MKVILLWYALQAAPFTEVRVSNAQRPTISFFKCQASEILVPVLLAPGGFGDWHALHDHLNFSYYCGAHVGCYNMLQPHMAMELLANVMCLWAL